MKTTFCKSRTFFLVHPVATESGGTKKNVRLLQNVVFICWLIPLLIVKVVHFFWSTLYIEKGIWANFGSKIHDYHDFGFLAGFHYGSVSVAFLNCGSALDLELTRGGSCSHKQGVGCPKL